MIRMGTYPPLRAVASWDGKRTLHRCDVCGCGVSADHQPGGEDCAELIRERAAKHNVSDE